MAGSQDLMVCRKFYLTIESAKNLRDVRELFPTRAYAKVSIGSPNKKIKLKTKPDNRNGLNPVWSDPMAFDISESGVHYYNISVVIELYTARTLGARYIGEVRTTVKDLYDYALENGSLSARQEFSIRFGREETDGTLKLSYGFGETFYVERTHFLKKAVEFMAEIVVAGIAQVVSFAIAGATAV